MYVNHEREARDTSIRRNKKLLFRKLSSEMYPPIVTSGRSRRALIIAHTRMELSHAAYRARPRYVIEGNQERESMKGYKPCGVEAPVYENISTSNELKVFTLARILYI